MDMQPYFTFLTDLAQTLDGLSALEQKKIQAIQNNDQALLDQYMKQEQAATMDLRGRERKRTQLLQQLGLESGSLRQLPDLCPSQYKSQASEIVQQVLRSYQVFSSAQQAARTLMESRLRNIQKELEHREETRQVSPSASSKPQSDFRV